MLRLQLFACVLGAQLSLCVLLQASWWSAYVAAAHSAAAAAVAAGCLGGPVRRARQAARPGTGAQRRKAARSWQTVWCCVLTLRVVLQANGSLQQAYEGFKLPGM